MDKRTAIALLGGSASSAAKAIGITPQAVGNWPEQLSARIEDRIHAALARQEKEVKSACTEANVAA